ncbi:hypothetical protein DMENIID0001_073590 [Sergentomyia squamirostris]
MVITGAKIYWLIQYTSQIAKLLTELQDHINTRARLGKGHHYFIADRLGNTFTKLFGLMVFIASVMYFFNPMLQILVQHLTKPGEPFIYKLPYHFELGVDSSISPNYQIIYMSSFLSLQPILNSMVAANCLFFCFSLLIAACFKDLQDMVLSIGENILMVDDPLLVKDDKASLIVAADAKPEDEKIFYQLMGECVEFHSKILRWIDEATSYISGIIAFEFAGCIFSFCTQAFQATINITSPEFLNSVVFFIAEGMELFLFAAFGERITTESAAVAEAVYIANWWRFPPKHRKYFQLMILRAQKPCYVRALNWLNCSLESYMNVLKASFSMMALLQNINEKGGFGVEQES